MTAHLIWTEWARSAAAAVVVFVAFAVTARSQTPPDPPFIFENGVVNAASFMAPPLAGSGLAQGSLISIFGTNLGPETGVNADQFPMATTLAGRSIEIRTPDDQTLAAIPLFVSAGQINAILPSETPAGPVRLTVSRDGIAGNSITLKVVRSSVGLFGMPGVVHSAIAQRFVSQSEQPLATPGAPARPGDTVTFWGTGLGAIEGPDTMPPPAGSLDTPVEVFVGHRPAEVSYQGRAPCCAGVDQLNVRIPDDAPVGCFVPVWITVRGSIYSNIATIPISSDGGVCGENPVTAPPLTDAAIGHIVLQRSVDLDNLLQPVPGATTDLATAQFRAGQETSNELPDFKSPAALEPVSLAVLPPPGTCLAYDFPGPNAIVSPIDAGDALLLDGTNGRSTIPRIDGDYRLEAPPAAPFLGAGSYQVEAPDTAAFPLFSGLINVGEPAHRQGTSFEGEPRLIGAVATWKLPESAPGSVLIVGRPSASPAPETGSEIKPSWVCTAEAGATSFRIPAAVLANFRETTADVQLMSLWGPQPLEFLTDTLESGTLAYLHSERANERIGQTPLASTPIRLPDGANIQAELAITFAEEQRGLMFRRELPADQGMLFVFDTPGHYGFWMYNTLVPLDIIWLDAGRRIVFINAGTPPCPPEVSTACPNYGGAVVAKYVLELAAGQVAAHGLGVGNTLEW